jgi:sucrose-6-phosphate hydrolase SacC (GH32 family)
VRACCSSLAIRVATVLLLAAGNCGLSLADEPGYKVDAVKIGLSDEQAIARAMASLRAATAKLKPAPNRPVYHFRPPALWMMDPDGSIFRNGWLHLFYQLNPYGDSVGTDGSCWGHARTKDLVHWEHLPIAIHPSYGAGHGSDERRCNSGSMIVNGAGQTMIFYTKVPFVQNAQDRSEQWVAIAQDDDLIKWKKYSHNPVIAPNADGFYHGDWGDPFLFQASGRTFLTGKADEMLNGARIYRTRGIPIYEAQNKQLTKWKYMGPLACPGGECPNFFPLGDKWVLLTSPDAQTMYYVGTFDLHKLKFTAQRQGILDHSYGPAWPDNFSRGFYATTVTRDPQGRWILWGWVSGFAPNRGWNGCLSLPRILSLGSDGHLRRVPAPELQQLRGKHSRVPALSLADRNQVVEGVAGDTLEIQARFVPGDAKSFGLRMRCSADGGRAVTIACDGKVLRVDGTEVPLAHEDAFKELSLHIFIDKALLEVFVNDGRYNVTRVMKTRPEDVNIALFSLGGTTSLKSLDVWEMKPVWTD